MFTEEERARNVFIDNTQRLLELTLDLPRGYYYPKRSSRGIRELNHDARLTIKQFELTIKQGVEAGILGSTMPNIVMRLLNDAGLLMGWLYQMRSRGEITRRTWRRARRLHRKLWFSVGNPPHNEF